MFLLPSIDITISLKASGMNISLSVKAIKNGSNSWSIDILLSCWHNDWNNNHDTVMAVITHTSQNGCGHWWQRTLIFSSQSQNDGVTVMSGLLHTCSVHSCFRSFWSIMTPPSTEVMESDNVFGAGSCCLVVAACTLCCHGLRLNVEECAIRALRRWWRTLIFISAGVTWAAASH